MRFTLVGLVAGIYLLGSAVANPSPLDEVETEALKYYRGGYYGGGRGYYGGGRGYYGGGRGYYGRGRYY
ncbi:hypothetical protein FBU30_000824 [Linnemannia zychae]|nr:hypothetical protein FBU30_000824 [Linnemannia zychae]